MRIGSMLKYFRERGGPDTAHGGKLSWPGTEEGFPFRGDVAPMLKQHEQDQIVHVLDYHSKLFRLWEPADKTEFDQVMDKIVNGWFMQHKRREVDIPGQILPAIWLEWVQIYGESPLGKMPGGGFHARNTTITLQEGQDPSQQPLPKQSGSTAHEMRRWLLKDRGAANHARTTGPDSP